MVVVVLLIVGVALIIFGAFVLLRFADRPGGEFEFQGIRVHSVGAGLPLIVLGVVAVVLAALQGGTDPATAADPATTTAGSSLERLTTTSRGQPTAPPATTRAASCLSAHFETEPKVNTAFRFPLPVGNTVPFVVVPSAFVLMRGTETIGALRVRYYPIGGPELTVFDVVNSQCQPGTWENSKISDGFLVTLTLPDGNRYQVTVDYSSGVSTPRATLNSLQ